MKKIIVLITGLIIFSFSYSQDYVEKAKGRFSTGVDIFTDIWLGKPAGMDTRTINQGCFVFLMYNHRFNESNFSGALGVGMGAHNLYSNTTLGYDSLGRTEFTPIENVPYKKSKVAVAYFDMPIELRYKSKKGFRVTVGFKGGVNINSHTKYKGDNLDGEIKPVKIKTKNVRNLENWRYGITGGIGYKWVNVVVFYSLSKLFEEGRGPQIYPVSIGVSLRPF